MKLRAIVALLLALTLLGSSIAFADYATLRKGSSGAAVTALQQALNELGYACGTADGKYGTKTYNAVRAFQKAESLTVDGIAGNETQTRLYALVGEGSGGSGDAGEDDPDDPVTDGCFSGNYATLKYGSSGSRVKILQNALNQLGYACGTADGKFGTATKKAVLAFQKAEHLTADGIAGKQTLTAIEAALGSGGSAGEEEEDDPVTPDAEEYETLRSGDTGEAVTRLQQALKDLNYDVAVTGTYDKATVAAVKLFQKNNGLTVDGLAGKQTQTVLYSGSAVGVPQPEEEEEEEITPEEYETLRSGDTGEAVTRLQQALKDLNYVLEVTGTYDSDTVAAVRTFQEINSLSVDGVAGKATQTLLYSGSALGYFDQNEIPESFRTLREGYTGSDVIALQKALAALNYKVEVTGVYDAQTIQAVRTFQANNGLAVDGVAGKATQTRLYHEDCFAFPGHAEGAVYGSAGYISDPGKSALKLLHWVDDIKDNVAYGQTLLIYDPATDISWALKIIARGRHCDAEPLTQADTDAMNKAFGKTTWTPKPVYVRLPDGTWTIGTTHNTPHDSYSIKDNGFDGHLCVHMLRDMSEAEENDPDYGVDNQNALRAFWKELTGKTIPYK